ncbi:MAG: tetratricopeptide repeat protein [Chloroflexi bacterium]|nr:tetratricopeptide repeat protein [Chloroflexota bacterium]
MNPLVKRIVLLGVVGVAGAIILAGAFGTGSALPAANPAAPQAQPTTRAAAPQPQATAQARPAQEQVPERVTQLQQRLAQNPKDANAMAELVDYFFQTKQYNSAADLLFQAVDQASDPASSSRLRVGLGQALFYLGMPATAQRELKRAIELDPNNVDAHFNYAVAMSHGPGANIDEARASWQAVVRLAGDGELGRRAKEFLAQLGPGPAPTPKP